MYIGTRKIESPVSSCLCLVYKKYHFEDNFLKKRKLKAGKKGGRI
jgi:hypothetical protein